MQDGRPIRTELNNGIINATKAMPLKDLTSDNQSSFEMDRKMFNKSYNPKTNFQAMPIGRSIVQRHSPSMHHGFVIDGPKSVMQKKWMNRNTDASSISESRRRNTTGAIMNYSGPQSFVNTSDNTTRINALTRVRGGGARVPILVSHKNVKPNMFSVFYH
jgi:hypothetical protein